MDPTDLQHLLPCGGCLRGSENIAPLELHTSPVASRPAVVSGPSSPRVRNATHLHRDMIVLVSSSLVLG